MTTTRAEAGLATGERAVAILRFLVFLGVVFGLNRLAKYAVEHGLPGLSHSDVGFLVREVVYLLILLGVAGAMGRFEGRTIADFGLPWRGALTARFWAGAGV